ncbi:MAG: hypothetical protein JW995_15755 [Melioribacteraceae bacterium]|nr:hypothetical protein [Melioribacteraceae bacterium]
MEISEDIKERCYEEYYSEINSLFGELNGNYKSGDSVLMRNCSKIKESFYLVYPFYFATCFDQIHEEELYSLTLSGNMYFSYLLLLDGFLDTHSGTTLISLHKLHENSLLKIVNIFPPGSSFWRYFEAYGKDFFDAVMKERSLGKKTGNEEYSYDNFKEIAIAKSAVAKCATAGLLSLSEYKFENDPFITTQDQFHIGLQIIDDFVDWKDDLRNNRNSFLLNMAFQDKDVLNAIEKGADKENVIGKYVYLSVSSIDLIQKAADHFKYAKECCADLNVPFWISLVDQYIKKSEDMLRDYENNRMFIVKQASARKKHVDNIKIGNSKKKELRKHIQKCISNALSYLLIERENGYQELIHAMKLPSAEIRIPKDPGIFVQGSIFQRTIVVDTYLDINNEFNNYINHDVIKSDINEIVEMRMKSVKGGWNYFPGYPFLPPDSDDLAQVMQILVKSDYGNISGIIDEHLSLLLEHNKNSDGTFKTWILNPLDFSEPQLKLKSAVENYWGDYYGRDLEVTSNILYALLLYNRSKYENVILKGMRKIKSSQKPDGFWQSVWYWGPYYGTYTSVRLLVESGNNSTCLKSAGNFILSTQNDDGGWGIEGSDPQNTAFAVLTLSYLDKNIMSISSGVIKSALSYLLEKQQQTGSWKKVPFIRMRVGEKDLTYKSESIVTAYVLKAIIKTFGYY